MGRYHGRHGARHAAPRVRRRPRLPGGAWTSKPAAVSMAIVTATATTAMAADSTLDPETVTLTLSADEAALLVPVLRQIAQARLVE